VATKCIDCGRRIWNAGYAPGRCDSCHEFHVIRDMRKVNDRAEAVELVIKERWDAPKRRGVR